ncbi:MAG: alpha/beta hydrolase, partial [Deltaproteobacteria bacterium]|nr:alpha/beta hydrolase [Deltaproteobacteria bacterium]
MPDVSAPVLPDLPNLPNPVDAPVAVYDVLGTQVGATSEGPEGAPAILLIHGVPGGTRDYRYLAPLLSRTLRVHRLDLPGYGAVRDAQWHDYSPDGRARLVVGVADALGLEELAVLGHSMGGPAAIATAAMVPHRVTALIVLASVGVRRHRGMALSPAQAGVLRWAAGLPGVGRALLPKGRKLYRRMGFPNADTLTARELRIDLANVMTIDFVAARRRAAAVRARALVAWADDDPLVEPEIGQRLSAVIPDAQTATYPSGGHNIQKTRARELTESIT